MVWQEQPSDADGETSNRALATA